MAWDKGHLTACRFVARDAGQVVGWAALSPVSARKVYAGVAEVSIYVRALSRRQGIGVLLLQALIDRSETAGIWTLQSGIFAENEASLRLHQQCGFRQVGVREKMGRMEYGPYRGQWRDVVLLERRSKTVGF